MKIAVEVRRERARENESADVLKDSTVTSYNCYNLQASSQNRTITIHYHHLESLNPKVMMMKLLRIMAVRR